VLAIRMLAFLLLLLLGPCALQALPGGGDGQRQRRLDIGSPIGAALVMLLA
jgi:hypothetical protein